MDKLKKWVHGNLMSSKMTPCKQSPWYQQKLGDEEIENSPAEEDSGVLVDE